MEAQNLRCGGSKSIEDDYFDSSFNTGSFWGSMNVLSDKTSEKCGRSLLGGALKRSRGSERCMAR